MHQEYSTGHHHLSVKLSMQVPKFYPFPFSCLQVEIFKLSFVDTENYPRVLGVSKSTKVILIYFSVLGKQSLDE